mgnify:CR=1 FL=1
MGIDLGTANTLVHVKGRGIVLREPSVVAIKSDTGDVLAVGDEAKQMIGRTPGNIVAIRPMKDGVIADFDVTQAMLKYFIRKAMNTKSFVRPRVVVGVPSGVTEVEKRAVIDAAQQAGAREAYLIEEPMAAAIGAGLPVEEATGNMVVDIGGGTADIAVVTMGSISISKSVKIAGNILDEDIIRYLRRERNIVIGEKTAESIKKRIGCAYLRDTELAIGIKGKHYITGMPITDEVNTTEIYLAMREHLEAIAEGVRSVLEVTPPELAGDISETGILLTGGGALLDGMDKLIEKRTGVHVIIPDDPLECVALGTGYAIEHMDILENNGGIFKTREEITGFKD